MNAQDFTSTITVDQTPEQVFDAINNVRGWWSENTEGTSQKINDVFTVHFGKVFITSKVTEFVPGKKVVWHVTDCNKPWLNNTKEWVDTKMSWEVSEKDGKTQIHFRHIGLVPEIECYGACSNAWGDYINGSLKSLINTGKGQPTP